MKSEKRDRHGLLLKADKRDLEFVLLGVVVVVFIVLLCALAVVQ